DTDLFSQMIPRLVEGAGSFAFDELSARNASRHPGILSCDFSRQANRRRVDRLRLPAVARPVQLFARPEKGQGLQNPATRAQKFRRHLARRVRRAQGALRRDLAAPATGAHLLPPRTALDVTATLQFDEIAAVAQDGPGLHELRKGGRIWHGERVS